MNGSAICGLLSAALMAVPVVRQEAIRFDYARFLKHNKDENLFKAAKKGMESQSYSWSFYDSLCIFAGLILLATSFVLEMS